MASFDELIRQGLNANNINKAFAPQQAPDLNDMQYQSGQWSPAPQGQWNPEVFKQQADPTGSTSTADVAAGPDDPMTAYLKSVLAPQAINPEERKKIEANMAKSETGLQNLGELQRGYNAQPVQTDLSPLMALTDAWSLKNPHLAESYKAPETAQTKINALAKLQGMSNDERAKMTDSLVKLSAGKNAAGQLKALGQAAKLEQSQQVSAQKQFDQNQKQNIDRLNGAVRLHDIWRDVDSGKLKNNASLKSLIIDEQRRLEIGASGATAQEGTVKRSMDTASETLKEVLNKLNSTTGDTVPPEVTKQLKNLDSTLTGSYMDAADTASDILKARSNPAQLKVIEKAHEAMTKSFGKRLGGWGPGTISGSASTPEIPQGIDPKDWAAATPAQQQEYLNHIKK